MDKVNKYLFKLMEPSRDETFLALETYATEHQVPIMEPVSINFLTQLLKIHKPTTILEIGTAIGYSALKMHESYPLATITTIEKDKNMYEIAKRNIKNSNKEKQIEIKYGDAIDVMEELLKQGKTYDFIFIDAAKGKYKQFFHYVQPLMNLNGVIVCDNVLFKGYVVESAKADNVRLQKLGKKIRDFNDWLVNHPNYHSSILPIGDGISISVKLK